jgi:anthranilate phosphoribosyltransferase
VLNAAAGLASFELAKDPTQFQRAVLDRFHDKLAVAEEAIDSGAAERKLEEWIEATRR